MSIIEIAIAFFAALSVSLLSTPLARRVALKCRLVDKPNRRKRHLITTPLLGGMSIYISFALTVAAGMFLLNGDSSMISFGWKPLCLLVIGGAGLMSIVGLIDDILGLSAVIKLTLHTVAAILVGFVFVTQGALLNVFLTGSSYAWLTAPLTVIWLVGITNSVNLLDHADGLSAGTCAIAAIFFTIINLISGNYPVAFISATLGGATIGFLFYNYNPASIFMGDCGSNMLGFMLGIIAVLGVYTPEGSIREIAIFAPVLILALPIIDTAFVLQYRWKNGKPLFDGDRNHLAHRLMRMGFSHTQSVMVLLVVAVLMGTLALLLPTLKPYQAVLLFAHAIGLIALFSFFMNRAETREIRK
ncbi:MAG: undecaprenyl/decaprenyl-phosphate alpha-N-acetylglucosaminyl 1-phosphate transferase [Candidatus Aegiribacteria sp.]|nr:undecaprenyl/decaprenyl-phosphate alpha-N-acetylglucosaminyl 1-phosphate transferase [Candidatus Aegiribacteria sp.]